MGLESNIRPFMDTALRVKATLLRTLLFMYMGGVVAFCSTCQETVSLFTVVKKYDENGACIQRIVWDLRRVNLRFLPAPWGPLGSPSAISKLDA